MSVWKKLNKQDAFVTTYVAKKSWNLQGSQLDSYGVKLLPAYSSFEAPVEETSPVNEAAKIALVPNSSEKLCSGMTLKGVNTCYFSSKATILGIVNSRRQVKISKVDTYGEDIVKTNILRVTANNGATPTPSSITVQQILNGQAKILIDTAATSITLTHDSGLCATNVYTYDLPTNCQFDLLVDVASITPTPTLTNTPAPTPLAECSFSLLVDQDSVTPTPTPTNTNTPEPTITPLPSCNFTLIVA